MVEGSWAIELGKSVGITWRGLVTYNINIHVSSSVITLLRET